MVTNIKISRSTIWSTNIIFIYYFSILKKEKKNTLNSIDNCLPNLAEFCVYGKGFTEFEQSQESGRAGKDVGLLGRLV